MNAKWILIPLFIACLALQSQLWLSENGFMKTRQLRQAVAVQSQENDNLRQRNEALEAEVQNLRYGLEAAEERARTDLGLVGERETFFRIVPARNDGSGSSFE